MKILMVNPKGKGFSAFPISVPMGTLALGSFLKERGHEIYLLDREIKNEPVKKIIEKFNPDVVCITFLSCSQVDDILYVAKTAKKFGLPVLCGGHMASAIPEQVLLTGVVDYVGFSEGEYTTLELLEVLQGKRTPESVKGIFYLNENKEMIKTQERPFADLSEFPVLDYSLLHSVQTYVSDYDSPCCEWLIFCAKCCPWNCSFCENEHYHRRKYRKRPIHHILEEIRIAVVEYNVQQILFCDELFGADKKYLRKLCAKFKELDFSFIWQCETRIGQLSREDMEIMYDAGCRGLLIGVESGSPAVLDRIKKNYDIKKMNETFHNAREVGIEIKPMIIFGFPDETQDDIKQTIHACFRMNAEVAPNFFLAIPRTSLYNQLLSSRRIQPSKSLNDCKKSYIGNTFTEKRLSEKNYSKIPTIDLCVIRSFFAFNNVFCKKPEERGGVKVSPKILLEKISVLIRRRRAKGKTLLESILNLINDILAACIMTYYAHAYPKIRKKYDLYAKNFGRQDWDDLPDWGE